MAIVSKTLTQLANREDLGAGVKTWRVDGVDARGRRWVHGSFKTTQAAAEVIRDGVVWDEAGLDKRELLEWVQGGGTVAAFDYTNREIVETDGEDHIYREFATGGREIALTLAWWLDTLTTGARNTIGGRVGADGDTRARVDQRYPPMVTVLPFLDAVENI